MYLYIIQYTDISNIIILTIPDHTIIYHGNTVCIALWVPADKKLYYKTFLESSHYERGMFTGILDVSLWLLGLGARYLRQLLSLSDKGFIVKNANIDKTSN